MSSLESGSPDFAVKIAEAYARIREDIIRTPVEFSRPLSEKTGARVFIKWECDQVTGSFKLRGALNKLRSLAAPDRARGVVSASTGNHGLAISHASKLEGTDLILFLPETVSAVKRKKLEDMGVRPEIRGASCEQTEAYAREYAGRTGRIFVSPYNDWDIVFGAGTVGLEAEEDVPDVRDVLVPVGGGGLIAGMAAYLRTVRPEVRTIGVEPETSAFMAASVAAGRLVDIEEKPTIADAVAGGIEPGAITFPIYRDFVERTLVVEERLIAASMALLYETHRRMVEGAGALPLAGLIAFPELFRDREVLLVVSGRNVGPDRFEEITGIAPAANASRIP
jgi:threonine dehydratase